MYSRTLLMAYLLFRNSFLKLFHNLLTNIIIRIYANYATLLCAFLRFNFVNCIGSVDMIAFERIKELAKKKKLSLVEVNDKAGLGTRSIYHWNKTQPSNSNLAAVAKVLNTTTDYLNGLTDNPDIPSESEKHGLTWQDLDMPYGGEIPDELKGMYRALAEQYVKDHPDSLKK